MANEVNMSMTRKEALEFMRLTEEASESDIRRKYKELALKYHPDKNPKYKDGEKFKKLGNACDLLINPPTPEKQTSVRPHHTEHGIFKEEKKDAKYLNVIGDWKLVNTHRLLNIENVKIPAYEPKDDEPKEYEAHELLILRNDKLDKKYCLLALKGLTRDRVFLSLPVSGNPERAASIKKSFSDIIDPNNKNENLIILELPKDTKKINQILEQTAKIYAMPSEVLIPLRQAITDHFTYKIYAHKK